VGRSEIGGKVMVQTHSVDSPVLQAMATLRIDEYSRPEKWAVQVVTDNLEDGEEVIDYNFTLVEDVVDYKKDLKAAIEQLMLYSDNNLVIGADGHKFNLLDKLKQLKK
jgi:hypothetical protein